PPAARVPSVVVAPRRGAARPAAPRPAARPRAVLPPAVLPPAAPRAVAVARRRAVLPPAAPRAAAAARRRAAALASPELVRRLPPRGGMCRAAARPASSAGRTAAPPSRSAPA